MQVRPAGFFYSKTNSPLPTKCSPMLNVCLLRLLAAASGPPADVLIDVSRGRGNIAAPGWPWGTPLGDQPLCSDSDRIHIDIEVIAQAIWPRKEAERQIIASSVTDLLAVSYIVASSDIIDA
jgi:hypothetical protein